ncbi:MAG TPA: hypothetical protein VGF61_05290 [Candidatus Acidoferrum sp.]
MRPADYGSDDRLPREPREPWARVTPLVLIVSLLFFGLFLYELVRDMEMPHLVDNAFMQIHTGGHTLLRVFGLTAAVAGGTLLQLFVPFALGFYFIRQRQPLYVALCLFFFFEQFLPIARYMADAQAQQLPWMSIGRYESLIHDWNYLFTQLGILSYDAVIASIVRSIGCLGMIGVVFWLLWRAVIDIALY